MACLLRSVDLMIYAKKTAKRIQRFFYLYFNFLTTGRF
jgi:hypothetical protein